MRKRETGFACISGFWGILEGDEKSKRRRLNLLDRIECGVSHEEMKVEAWNGDSCGIWGLPHDRTSYDDNDVYYDN